MSQGGAWSWDRQTARADAGVEVVTVDGLVCTAADGALVLVRVDIEGFENGVFSANVARLDVSSNPSLSSRMTGCFLEGHQSGFAVRAEKA